jgi:SAM-dependent methyltransferase
VSFLQNEEVIDTGSFMRARKKSPSPNLVAWNDLDLELFFATEILGLRSLHYGYWDNIDAEVGLNLKEISAAQSRLTQQILSCIPEGVKTVLDVGAGIGDNARALSKKGFLVTSISPDRNHHRYFEAMRDPNTTFRQCYFEDFESEKRYDLILFSESLNYVDYRTGLKQCKRYINPGGYILIAGMFRYIHHREFPPGFRLGDLEYIRLAREYGFERAGLVDITRNCLPTMKLVHRALERYARPLIDLIERRAPAWLLPKQREKLSQIFSYYQLRTDPGYFLKHVRYAILLLKDGGITPARPSRP